MHHHRLRHGASNGRVGIWRHGVSRRIRRRRQRCLHRHLWRRAGRHSRMEWTGSGTRAGMRRTRHCVGHGRRLHRAIVVRDGWRSSVTDILRLRRVVIGLLVDRPTTIISHDGLGSKMLWVVHQTRRPLTKMSSSFRLCVECQRQTNFILDSRNG
jgi:hypothetical protein